MLKKTCRKGTPKGQTINSKVTKIVNGKQDVFTKYVNGSTSANSIWFHLKFLINISTLQKWDQTQSDQWVNAPRGERLLQ